MRRSIAVGLAVLVAIGLLFAREPPAVRAGDLPAPPLISIDPSCAGQIIEGTFDQTFTFRLRNFTPNAPVTVQFGTGEPVQQQPVTVGGYGALDVQLTFTRGFGGDTPITAFETANPAVTASTTLRVPCTPAVRLMPNCDAPADPAAPRNISIVADGTNWDPFGGPVTVALFQRSGGSEIQISSSVQVTPTDQLTFSATINAAASSDDVAQPLAALPAGDYFVMSIQPQSNLRIDADFAVPCPQLTLNPNCGDAGAPFDIYDIAITGSGFRPFTQAQVIFDAFGQPQVFLLDVGATGQLLIGDVEEARIKPFRRPELPGGAYAVIVRQTHIPDVVDRETAAVAFVVPCPPPPPQPQVTIDPLCGPPAIQGDDPAKVTSLRIVGATLEAGSVLIQVTPAGGSAPVFESTLPHSGSFDADLNLPRLPVGTYRIDVSQQLARGPFAASFEFLVPCSDKQARLRLRCNADPANPDLADVVVQATRFYEDAPLELSIGGNIQMQRTDGSGRFTGRIPASDVAAGTVQISATQRDTNGVVVAEATDTILVPCRTGVPTVTISPGAGSPGLVVVVEGSKSAAERIAASALESGHRQRPIHRCHRRRRRLLREAGADLLPRLHGHPGVDRRKLERSQGSGHHGAVRGQPGQRRSAGSDGQRAGLPAAGLPPLRSWRSVKALRSSRNRSSRCRDRCRSCRSQRSRS